MSKIGEVKVSGLNFNCPFAIESVGFFRSIDICTAYKTFGNPKEKCLTLQNPRCPINICNGTIIIKKENK